MNQHLARLDKLHGEIRAANPMKKMQLAGEIGEASIALVRVVVSEITALKAEIATLKRHPETKP
mgnify:CR=1 FL=1